MAAGTWNIEIEQGATWIRTITVEDDGAGRDLTGYEIRMHARSDRNATETFVELSTDTGEITITDAANGVFQLALTATETAALAEVAGYVYDIELEDSSGVVTRLLRGAFGVSREVTR